MLNRVRLLRLLYLVALFMIVAAAAPTLRPPAVPLEK